MPAAATVKVADCPAKIDWLEGWVAISGADCPLLITTTVYGIFPELVLVAVYTAARVIVYVPGVVGVPDKIGVEVLRVPGEVSVPGAVADPNASPGGNWPPIVQ